MNAKFLNIREAAERISRSPEETYALLKDGQLSGFPDCAFPLVDPDSVDEFNRKNKHPAQRPLIPPNAETIAARAAWTEPEEAVIRGCQDRYEAVAAYRLEFPNSHRTDYAIGKHWYRMRSRKPEKAGGIWSWICSLFRKAAGV